MVRYFHPAGQHPARIIRVDKYLAIEFDFKCIKFPLRIRDIHKIEKRIVSSSMFWVTKTRKNIQFMCEKNNGKQITKLS